MLRLHHIKSFAQKRTDDLFYAMCHDI